MDHGDWISHMTQKHWRSWNCPFCPSIERPSPVRLKAHILFRHLKQVSRSKRDLLISLCGTSDLSRCRGTCPLCCVFDIETSDQYLSHIDQHLEQLTAYVFSDILDKVASGDSEASINHSSVFHDQPGDAGPSFAKLSSTDTTLKSSGELRSSVSSVSDQLKMISISRPVLEPSQDTEASTRSDVAEQAHPPEKEKSAPEAIISLPSDSSPPQSSHEEDSISSPSGTASTEAIRPSSDRTTQLYNTPGSGGGCYMEAHRVRSNVPGPTGKYSTIVYIWTCCYCGSSGMNAHTTPACTNCGTPRCGGQGR